MEDIAVIIINYNTSKYTVDCVISVIEKTTPAITYSIHVIDNNSNSKDFENLKKKLPKKEHIKLHRSVINMGFGAGNMFGVQFVKAKYLLFLNNDAFLQNDCLSILYDYMESNPNVAVSTAQNYDNNGKRVISFDHFKGLRKLIFGRGFLENFFSKNNPKRKKEYKEPVSVNFINGAFMFFNSRIFAEVGGFDTNIFLYFEEMDICYRLKKRSYETVLVPNAKITHYQGASTGTSKAISKEGFISYLYIIKKNYSYLKYATIRIYFCITAFLKPRKWFLLPLILKGAHISKSLKQNQQIQF